MKQTYSEEFLQELKELVDYAIDARSWATIEEIREMLYEELGEEIFGNKEEESDDY
jgi:hypothetical protein